MKNNIIVGIIVLIIVVVVGYFFLGNTKEELPTSDDSVSVSVPASPAPPVLPPATSGEPQTFVVKYTDTGYNPKIITVKVGDTVDFINESARRAWTASDPHPVHTNLEGFDQGQGATEGTYSYRFNEAGNWGFHDHLNPVQRGTVIVQE